MLVWQDWAQVDGNPQVQTGQSEEDRSGKERRRGREVGAGDAEGEDVETKDFRCRVSPNEQTPARAVRLRCAAAQGLDDA